MSAASQKIKDDRAGCYLASWIPWLLQIGDPDTLSDDSCSVSLFLVLAEPAVCYRPNVRAGKT